MRINHERGFYGPRHQSHTQLCEVFGHLNELFRTYKSESSTSETDVFCEAVLKELMEKCILSLLLNCLKICNKTESL